MPLQMQRVRQEDNRICADTRGGDMKYATAIRSILEGAPSGLTPQQIRDAIKQDHPDLYDNPVARNNVARGHYKDLDHALLSRIYTASKSSKHYTRDESVEPIVVSLSDGAHKKISITKFFAETLRVPLSNSRWSWGAYSADKNVVVLRTWEDERRVIDGQQMVRIHLPGAGSSAGESERKRHVELLSRGVPGFAVMCEAINTDAPSREIASFEDQVVERLGALHTGPDGAVWVEIVGEVAVDEFDSEVAQLSAPVRVSTLLTPGQVPVRRTGTQVQRASQRRGRGPLHPTRSHSPDGGYGSSFTFKQRSSWRPTCRFSN